MATTVNELVVEISAKNDKLKKGFDDSEKKVVSSTKKIDRSLRNTAKTSQATGNTVSKSFKGAAAAVSSMQGPLNSTSGKLSAMSTTVRGLTSSNAKLGFAVGGAAVAVGAIGVAMFKAASAADTYRLQMNRLEAVVNATNGAVGLSTQQLEDFAQTLARDTLASVEGVIAAQQKLATFTSVTGDTFTRALKLSQDLAETGFGSLESGAVGLGKALQDPLTGMMLLNKQGTLTKNQQREIAEEFKKTGDLAKAQGQILDAVAKQVGGVASSSVGTLTGNLDSMGQSFDNLIRLTGDAVNETGLFTGVVKFLDDAMQGLADTLSSPDQLTSGKIEGRISAVRKELDELAKSAGSATDSFITAISLDTAGAEINIKALNNELTELTKIQDKRLEAANKAGQAGLDSKAAAIEELQIQNKLKEVDEARAKLATERVKASEIGAGIAGERQQQTRGAATGQGEGVGTSEQVGIIEQLEARNAKIMELERISVADRQALLAESSALTEQQLTQSLQSQIEAEEIADEEKLSRSSEFGQRKLDMLTAQHEAEQARMQELRAQGLETELTGFLEDDALKGEAREEARQLLIEKVQEAASARQAILQESYESERMTLAEAKAEEVRIWEDAEQKITAVKEEQEKKRTRLTELANNARFASNINSAAKDLMALSGNSKKAFEVTKKLSLATSIAAGYTAVQRALAENPYPYNIAAAAAMATKTALQVKNIQSTSFGSSSQSDSTGGAAPANTGQGATQAVATAQAPTLRPINLSIEGGGLFTSEQVRGLIDQIRDQEELGNV